MVPSILKLVWGRMVPSDLQMYNDGAWFQAYQKLAWGSMVPNRNVLGCIMMAFTMHRCRLKA